MTRRFWIPATALWIASVMAVSGFVSRDAMAGIVFAEQSGGGATGTEEGPAGIRNAADGGLNPAKYVSARSWTRVIVLLVIILLILWLIYRTFTGWKPMIS